MCYQLQEMLQERTLYMNKLQDEGNEQRKNLLDEVLLSYIELKFIYYFVFVSLGWWSNPSKTL